jgi:hypothetical protein
MNAANEDLEILSALIDGVAVDPDRLAAVLEGPHARAALVDFVRFRWSLAADAATGHERLPDIELTAPGRLRSITGFAATSRTWRSVLAAAAMISLALLVGYGVGKRTTRSTDEIPPTPDRVVTFTPGTEWGANR